MPKSHDPKAPHADQNEAGLTSDREAGGFNRRGFLKISSVAAAAAAVAATGSAAVAQRDGKRTVATTRSTTGAKDHKGAWFIV